MTHRTPTGTSVLGRIGRTIELMKVIAILAIVALSGCALDDQADTGTDEQAVSAENKLATNKLATNKLATNKLAANKLAAASFSLGTAGSPLIETSDGRDVLTYMLGCALSATQSLTLTTSTGTPVKSACNCMNQGDLAPPPEARMSRGT